MIIFKYKNKNDDLQKEQNTMKMFEKGVVT